MREAVALLASVFASSHVAAMAQQASSNVPNRPVESVGHIASPIYSPPTQSERFKAYARQTYGPASIFEAAAHSGINQARDQPSEWPQGAEGYGDRLGSAAGEIITRETTEYMVADLLREDIRRIPCRPSTESKFKLAFEDSFLARRGDDGHRSLSAARLIGPFSGNIVASNTWYPACTTRAEKARGIGLTFGLVYVRSLMREIIAR